MSENKSAAEAGRGCRTPGCLFTGFGLVIFFLLMVSGIGIGLLELGWTLLFGWAGFLARVIPRITYDWAAIATGIVFACLLSISLHFFLIWLSRSIALARDVSFQWQWKWTYCSMLLLALCLLVGMALAGAAHQLGWILAGKEPLFLDRYSLSRQRVEAIQVEWATRQALLGANTLPELRQRLSALISGSQRKNQDSPLESVRLLVSLTPSNTIDGVLIVVRDKQFETTYGAKYLTTNDASSMSAKDLPRFIQLNATNMVAF